ncbi:MAG TPA: CPBP family glutamic-type intramembrane protease [Vicinamibacterales bacterium]|nr:CPBP family glutamic-type intramembrane protease [Vicinamibacterales bacterium]
MIVSAAILATVLTYTWLLAPVTPRWMAVVAGALVIALGLARAWRAHEWGLAWPPFLPSLSWNAAFTAAAAGTLAIAGWQRHTWHARSLTTADIGVLLLWALGQQFALQITLLREAQATTSRSAGVPVAALLFAALHLPNPFLTVVTFVAALAWCRIYDRYPNLVPVTLSHALLTIVVLTALDDTITGRLRVGIAFLR